MLSSVVILLLTAAIATAKTAGHRVVIAPVPRTTTVTETDPSEDPAVIADDQGDENDQGDNDDDQGENNDDQGENEQEDSNDQGDDVSDESSSSDSGDDQGND